MSLYSLVVLLATTLLFTNASPVQKRQDCTVSSCVAYSGTSMWFEVQTGASCPSLTPPASIALAVATPTDHPESCFYPKSLDYCQLGQSAAMATMSSVATAIYNAQSSGAVFCGATKTANLPIIAPAPAPVTVTPPSEITVTAQS